MTNGTKAIVSIILAIVLFGGGLLTGAVIREAKDNRLIEGYKQTIASVRLTNAELENTNNQLAENNSRLKETAGRLSQQLDGLKLRIGDAERVVGEIESALSGSSDTIKRIIGSVRSLIEKIGEI